jgi:hypothetical protein
MIDYCLKFDSEEQALEQMVDFTCADGFLQATQEFALDPVGVIYKPTGVTETDEDGIVYPVVEALAGYHINLRMLNSELPEELQQFVVTPSTPSRTFC